jgi:hypothetical protein
MSRIRVHQLQCGTGDSIAHTCQPPSSTRLLFVPVQTQHLYEQHLGERAEYTSATGSRRGCFGQA